MDQNTNPEKEAQAAVQEVMPQQKKPGRMALQIFAVVVLLSLVGYGVYAWQNNRVADLQKQITELKKDSTVAVTDTSSTDPYAEWKTYTTNYEKLTFKYPTSLTLKYESTPGSVQQLTPGTESVTLTAKSGLRLKIWNGVDGIGGYCDTCKSVKNDTLSFLGGTSYLNYIDRGNTGLIDTVPVATDKSYYMSGTYKSKNITIDQTGGPTINLYTINYVNAKGESVPKSLATYTNDPALANIKLVLQSFNY